MAPKLRCKNQTDGNLTEKPNAKLTSNRNSINYNDRKKSTLPRKFTHPHISALFFLISLT